MSIVSIMKTKIILFLNQKGGVGKTTSAINLGASLAEMGKRTLLIDIDSQGNLTSGVGLDARKPGVYEVLAGSAALNEVIQQTAVRNLFAIGSNIHMAGLAIELVNQDRREYFIRDAFSPLEGNWEYIIIDCPPSLGLVTINAMVWANEIIIPMQSEYFAMEGLTLLMHTIGNIKKSLNPELEVLGILFTMYSKRTRLSRDVVDDIVSYFDDLVFDTMIPRNIRLAEAPSHGLPINQYDGSCNGAKAYRALAKEVIKRGK